MSIVASSSAIIFFFFNDTATTEIYTLSLHDALPIWNDPRVLLLDLQYHDVRPERGLYYTLERSNLVDRLLQDSEIADRSEEHTSELQSLAYLVCRLLLEKKKKLHLFYLPSYMPAC